MITNMMFSMISGTADILYREEQHENVEQFGQHDSTLSKQEEKGPLPVSSGRRLKLG